MLHQISWLTYAVSILFFIGIYYLYIGLTFYRLEIQTVFNQLTGRHPALQNPAQGNFIFSKYDITGKAQPDEVEIVSHDDLSFGPAQIPDEETDKTVTALTYNETNSKLTAEFSEMVAEVKTLIRVINESSESKENFEMLFRLIIQKYHNLAATPYQQQINDFLLDEGAPEFPFPLFITDLENYWINEN